MQGRGEWQLALDLGSGETVAGTLVEGRAKAAPARHQPAAGVQEAGPLSTSLRVSTPRKDRKLRLMWKVLLFKCQFKFF